MLFPSFHAHYSNKKQLIGFIGNIQSDWENFAFIVIDSMTNEMVSTTNYAAKDIIAFVDEFPSNYKNIFKVLIIELFDMHLDAAIYHKTIDEFCRRLKAKIDDLGIPHYFITLRNYDYSALLILSKFEAEIDDNIIILLPAKSGFEVGHFKFTSNGYQLLQQRTVTLDFKASPATLKQQILGSIQPSKIIFGSSTCISKKFPFKKVFKGINLFAYEWCMERCRVKVVMEISKWVLDRTYCKFHIIPFSNKAIKIIGRYGTEKNEMDILNIEVDDLLPLSKIVIVPRSIPEIWVQHYYRYGHSERKELQTRDYHRYEFTATIDENNITNVNSYKLLYENLECSTFDEKLDSKIPMIALFDNSSVIAVHKSNEGYQFLNEWNGLYGKDLYISFDQKKKQFGQVAMEALKAKNTFVVYDFLKIMSMPESEIKAEKHWGFTFTKDKEHPVLTDFNYFGGLRKSSPPEFLMAASLKQHLKAIKNECGGEKPTKVALCILQEFNKQEMERVQEGLRKACELLKVECIFVEI